MKYIDISGLARLWNDIKAWIENRLSNVSVDKVQLQGADNAQFQKFWRGTKAEYDAITTKEVDVMYITTDEDTDVTPKIEYGTTAPTEPLPDGVLYAVIEG